MAAKRKSSALKNKKKDRKQKKAKLNNTPPKKKNRSNGSNGSNRSGKKKIYDDVEEAEPVITALIVEETEPEVITASQNAHHEKMKELNNCGKIKAKKSNDLNDLNDSNNSEKKEKNNPSSDETLSNSLASAGKETPSSEIVKQLATVNMSMSDTEQSPSQQDEGTAKEIDDDTAKKIDDSNADKCAKKLRKVSNTFVCL